MGVVGAGFWKSMSRTEILLWSFAACHILVRNSHWESGSRGQFPNVVHHQELGTRSKMHSLLLLK